MGSVAAVCIYKEIVEEKRVQSRPPQDYDYESISRVPTMEMMESAPGGGGTKFNSANFGNMHSAPGSPSTTSIRKSVGGGVSSALSSPYASPAKGLRPPLTNSSSGSSSSSGLSMGIAESGGSLFKNMIDSRPFQQQQQARHKYESVPDREN